jgi:uncharacterized coiled-coil protein SlyX
MAMSLLGDTSHLFIEFKPEKIENPAKTREAGRPIFDDIEMCSIQHVGDQKTWLWIPAAERSIYIRDKGGAGRYVTYAECYYEHYKAFKEGEARAQSGTPIEELPFLTNAKRAELKALNIHTAEALAQLDGTPLTRLGMGGREMKNQAQAYLDRAKEGAMDAKLAAQNARLQEEIEQMREQLANVMEKLPKAARKKIEAEEEEKDAEAPSLAWSDDDLRAFIKERTGTGVRGQPAKETLVRMAEEAKAAEPRAED